MCEAFLWVGLEDSELYWRQAYVSVLMMTDGAVIQADTVGVCQSPTNQQSRQIVLGETQPCTIHFLINAGEVQAGLCIHDHVCHKYRSTGASPQRVYSQAGQVCSANQHSTPLPQII